MTTAALRLEGFSITLPSGKSILKEANLVLERGETVVVFGPSGSGKTTLIRSLFEADILRAEGFVLSWKTLDTTGLGLVPQNGALLDHLDVRHNVTIAADYAGKPPDEASIKALFEQLELPVSLLEPGRSTGTLSGGQRQRVAVARALTSGEDVIIFDEPTAGIDPSAKASLIKAMRAHDRKITHLVITHDVEFAALIADRILFLDPTQASLEPLEFEKSDDARAALERAVMERIEKVNAQANDAPKEAPVGPSLLIRLKKILQPFGVFPSVVASLFQTKRHQWLALWPVFGHALKSALIRPALFYGLVALLLGYTTLFVIGRAVPEGMRASRAIELIGGSYILALTTPIFGLVFSATGGSAISAWLGSMNLTQQTMALRALGIQPRHYLWLPIWISMTIAFVFCSVVFTGGMLVGGAIEGYVQGVTNPWPLLLGDLIDPIPERRMLRFRMLWLIFLYAGGIASEVIYRSSLPKHSTDEVTRGMTSSVIINTLWIVVLELISALILTASVP